MFKNILRIIYTFLLVSLSNSAFAIDSDIKISLTKHNLTMQIGNIEATINGQNFSLPVAPIVKEGRAYIPIRSLEKAGYVLSWSHKGKYAEVVIPAPHKGRVRYIKGKNYVTDTRNMPVANIQILSPFIKEDRLFIPLARFDFFLSKAASTSGRNITISWADEDIESKLPERTAKTDLMLNILYEQPLLNPQISASSEGMMGKATINNKGISVSGKKYVFGTYNLHLDPGVNLISVDIMRGYILPKYYKIYREVANPKTIPIKYFDFGIDTTKYNSKDYLEVVNPNGFVKSIGSLNINFRADLKRKKFGDNILNLEIMKIEKNYLKQYKNLKVPLKNRKFMALIKISEKGSYIINVFSPIYGEPVVTPKGIVGVGSSKWAKFYAEIN